MEWIAYSQLEPFGDERADLRSAIIASTIYNMMRGKKSRPMEPKDFMPRFRGQTRQQSPEEMMHRIRAAVGSKRFVKKEG